MPRHTPRKLRTRYEMDRQSLLEEGHNALLLEGMDRLRQAKDECLARNADSVVERALELIETDMREAGWVPKPRGQSYATKDKGKNPVPSPAEIRERYEASRRKLAKFGSSAALPSIRTENRLNQAKKEHEGENEIVSRALELIDQDMREAGWEPEPLEGVPDTGLNNADDDSAKRPEIKTWDEDRVELAARLITCSWDVLAMRDVDFDESYEVLFGDCVQVLRNYLQYGYNVNPKE